LNKRFWRRKRQEEVGATSSLKRSRFQESEWGMNACIIVRCMAETSKI
jgi:hypothetical protein